MEKNKYNNLITQLSKQKNISNLNMEKHSIEEILQELDIYHAELIAQNEELLEKEERLIASKEDYELLFYDAPVAYLVIDKSFTIQKFNKKANECFSFYFTPSLENLLFSHISISFLETVLNWISKKDFLSNGLEVEMKTKDKKLRRFMMYGNYYPSSDDSILLSFIDVNDEYLLKNDLKTQVHLKTKENLNQYHILQQQSKFAAMGEMIGNIAHQWRQPLNILSAYNLDISLKFKNNKLTKEDMYKFSSKTELTIQKMSETIESFVNFFNPNKEEKHFKIKDVINEVFNLLDSSFHKNQIVIDVNCKEETSYLGHRSEFEQILLIILNNSRDAIISNKISGRIIINVVKILNKELKIEIIDNAGGIDEEIIDRIFEPYFTTKAKSIGTGIGLYMSKMIVEESFHGSIRLENYTKGVRTIITLPINK